VREESQVVIQAMEAQEVLQVVGRQILLALLVVMVVEVMVVTVELVPDLVEEQEV